MPDSASRSLVVPSHVDSQIELAATEIRACSRQAMLEFTCRVGQIVLDRIYAGDLAAFRDRGRKENSIRKLAERLDGDVSLSAVELWRCVAIYDVVRRVTSVYPGKHVTARHVREVLPLHELQQEELLVRAEQNAWSARELATEVKRLRQVASDQAPAPRRPTPRCVRTIRAMQRLASSPDAMADLEVARRLGVSELRELHAIAFRLQEFVESFKLAISPKRVMAQRTAGDADAAKGLVDPGRLAGLSRRGRRRLRDRPSAAPPAAAVVETREAAEESSA